MKKIGITGSIASGKTTAGKILSARKGPLFSADKIVKKLYKIESFKKFILNKFKIKNNSNIKLSVRNKILENKSNIIKLEKIIHPLVRKEMKKFIKLNKKNEFIFLEIPLLVESKLMKYFDIIIFIKTKKSLRLKRFISKGGNKKLFNLLNKKQLSDKKKAKYCDHIIVNEKDLKFLKKNLLDILSIYE